MSQPFFAGAPAPAPVIPNSDSSPPIRSEHDDLFERLHPLFGHLTNEAVEFWLSTPDYSKPDTDVEKSPSLVVSSLPTAIAAVAVDPLPIAMPPSEFELQPVTGASSTPSSFQSATFNPAAFAPALSDPVVFAPAPSVPEPCAPPPFAPGSPTPVAFAPALSVQAPSVPAPSVPAPSVPAPSVPASFAPASSASPRFALASPTPVAFTLASSVPAPSAPTHFAPVSFAPALSIPAPSAPASFAPVSSASPCFALASPTPVAFARAPFALAPVSFDYSQSISFLPSATHKGSDFTNVKQPMEDAGLGDKWNFESRAAIPSAVPMPEFEDANIFIDISEFPDLEPLFDADPSPAKRSIGGPRKEEDTHKGPCKKRKPALPPPANPPKLKRSYRKQIAAPADMATIRIGTEETVRGETQSNPGCYGRSGDGMYQGTPK
ncbi:hypothetical protein MMC22_008718 [Lobaria immixta]|nr:hypothetical protein [Lobaria immixta]